MPVVTSPDGTEIAYESSGSGPALVLVDGAMCYRGAGPMRPLAALLRASFTVFAYDRRGRGESSDTPPYDVSREVEDLQAIIGQAGGVVGAYGMSSGAALVLATAAAGPGITRVALYEPPFLAEIEDGPRTREYSAALDELIRAGRRGDAVALFMSHVGIPREAVAGMRNGPGWATLEAIAPTLGYDDRVLGDSRVPRARTAAISVPALVFSGGASPQNLQLAAKATAGALPAGEHRTLDHQTHDVAPEALAPVLIEFFRQ